VIDRDTVDLAQHAVGEDAVQIERDHDRDVVADDLARRSTVPFGIELTVGPHRAVQ
jgi:hypothetical protein